MMQYDYHLNGMQAGVMVCEHIRLCHLHFKEEVVSEVSILNCADCTELSHAAGNGSANTVSHLVSDNMPSHSQFSKQTMARTY